MGDKGVAQTAGEWAIVFVAKQSPGASAADEPCVAKALAGRPG
jgi:hypothetical protein